MTRKWSPTEITALIAVALGFILEFAPLLLLNVAPLASLASVSPVQVGPFLLPYNVFIADMLIFGGGLVFILSVRKHKRGA